MCELTNDKSKVKTGYKVLAIKNGKYYSTFTGQEIKTGKVPMSPEYCTRLSEYWSSAITSRRLENVPFYNNKLKGKTSAFLSLHDTMFLAKSVHNCITYTYKVTVVKISFRGDVYAGHYNSFNIIAGDIIRSIKLIEIL